MAGITVTSRGLAPDHNEGTSVGLNRTTVSTATTRIPLFINATGALDGVTGSAVLKLQDNPGSDARTLQVEHYAAAANSGSPQNYGIEIHNYPGANSPFVIHQYSQDSNSPGAVVIDNTGSGLMFLLRNTENSVLAPGQYGTGQMLQVWDYVQSRTLFTGNVASSSQNFTCSVGSPFSMQDVGKQIVIQGAGAAGGVLTTSISAFVSGSAVTLANAASTTVTNAQFAWGSTYTDGAMTNGSAVLTASTSQMFTASDPGKSITVVGAGPAAGNLNTTILSYQSASQVTLAASASTTVTNASFVYLSKNDVTNILQWQGGTLANQIATYGPRGITITSVLAESPALTVVQPANGNTSAVALSVSQSSNASALAITQNGNIQAVTVTNNGTSTALQIVQNAGSASALTVSNGAAGSGVQFTQLAAGVGFNALSVNGYDFGMSVSTNASASSNGRCLLLTNNIATGAGSVLLVQNKGTGPLADFQQGSAPTSVFQIQNSGQMKYTASGNEATGAGSAALGANSPAVTNTAPYKWWKVTTSDGSAGFIPVWK